jgi:hypothetical protein
MPRCAYAKKLLPSSPQLPLQLADAQCYPASILLLVLLLYAQDKLAKAIVPRTYSGRINTSNNSNSNSHLHHQQQLHPAAASAASAACSAAHCALASPGLLVPASPH